MKAVHENAAYRLAVAAVASLATASVTLGGSNNSVPDYDFDWAVIGDPGNAPYEGEIHIVGSNRGGVDYTYRMSKKEVSSGQWLEFITTIGPLLGDAEFGAPSIFGYFDLSPGSYIPFTQFADQIPVQGITWRESAMYANWLHNGKEASIAAISNGAYDISTFKTNPDGTFTDQVTRSPDAKFWIPSLDEWLKAAHYDPNKNGEGQGGWWEFSNTSDTAPVPGPPGVGESSADRFDLVYDGVLIPSDLIPLGAYPETTSPWGLLDTSGGAGEWTEEKAFPWSRVSKGSWAFSRAEDSIRLERIGAISGGSPDWDYWQGLRLASAIPGPGSIALFMVGCGAMFHRRGR